jgi:hypothetical protein
VYVSADHKEGYVTARSLSGKPVFHAENLGELEAGAIDPWGLEPNGKIFDRYVASLPVALRARAEGFRVKAAGKPIHHRPRPGAAVIHDPVHSLFLVPGTGTHPGLPGNYLYGSIFQTGADAETSEWAVQVHDSDDGVAVHDAHTLKAALEKFHEVVDSAPFTLAELEALDFHLV